MAFVGLPFYKHFVPLGLKPSGQIHRFIVNRTPDRIADSNLSMLSEASRARPRTGKAFRLIARTFRNKTLAPNYHHLGGLNQSVNGNACFQTQRSRRVTRND
jgi:hypothetical protein